MAEIQSPISGGLRVARRTVSADAFVRAAPAPPPVAQPDPVTTTLIQRNSLALDTVSGQLASLTQQVNSLSASLQSVYININQSSALERQQNIQEQNQEAQLAEQQLRSGKESIIERRIQNALVAPVQRVAAKTTFTLSRVRDFFLTILGGWLVNQAIQTIKALSEGNKKKLEDIRNNVVKNLGIIGGIYAGIRFGLTAAFNGITGLASKITAAVAQNLFLKPVQALLDGVKGAANKLIPKIKKILPGFSKPGATPPPPPKPPSTSTPPPPPTASAPAARNTRGFGLGSILGAAGLGTGLDIMGGENPARAAVSNIAAAGTSAGIGNLAMRFAPGPFKIPAYLLSAFFSYGPASNMFKGFYDKGNELFEGMKSNNNLSSKPINNKISDVAFNKKTENLMSSEQDVEKKSDIVTTANEQDFSKPAMYGEITVAQLVNEKSQTEAAQISGGISEKQTETAQIMPIRQEATITAKNIGPLPEPSPTILPFPLPGSTQNTQSVASSQTGESATRVPSIDPENKDNYLLVYSHSVYNVPMT